MDKTILAMNKSNIKQFIIEIINYRFGLISKGRSHYKGKIFEQSMTNIIGWMENPTCDYVALLIRHEKTLRMIVKKDVHKLRLENYFREANMKPVKKIVEFCLNF